MGCKSATAAGGNTLLSPYTTGQKSRHPPPSKGWNRRRPEV